MNNASGRVLLILLGNSVATGLRDTDSYRYDGHLLKKAPEFFRFYVFDQ
jgi:hypothetical protein